MEKCHEAKAGGEIESVLVGDCSLRGWEGTGPTGQLPTRISQYHLLFPRRGTWYSIGRVHPFRNGIRIPFPKGNHPDVPFGSIRSIGSPNLPSHTEARRDPCLICTGANPKREDKGPNGTEGDEESRTGQTASSAEDVPICTRKNVQEAQRVWG